LIMPLFQYFGWVGSFLFVALFAANWCCSAPVTREPDVPLDQKINIRIHSDHKWPEPVVFDMTAPKAAPEASIERQMTVAASGVPAQPLRQHFDAFVQMPAMPSRPCFLPPCSAPQEPDRSLISEATLEIVRR
jgi:hypothetical protein